MKKSDTEKKWYDDIIINCPRVFSHLKHIECEPGWHKLISSLSSIIESHIEYSIPDDIKDEIFALQIKEKFGGLRFYLNHSDPYINGAIRMAEEMSFTICTNCGNPPEKIKNQSSWIRTLCKPCFEKRIK
jgi:hypothetical protein